jgi:hypothetical protein
MSGHDLQARRGLLEGAMHVGAALRAGAALGHAIAQAIVELSAAKANPRPAPPDIVRELLKETR